MYNEYVGCSLKLDDRLDFASLAVFTGKTEHRRILVATYESYIYPCLFKRGLNCRTQHSSTKLETGINLTEGMERKVGKDFLESCLSINQPATTNY